MRKYMLEQRRDMVGEYCTAVILTSVEESGMKSKRAKLTHEICGRPMLQWVCRAVGEAGLNECLVVLDHETDQVRHCLECDVRYVLREEQQSYACAVEKALDHNGKIENGVFFILPGDMPLITSGTIAGALEFHRNGGYSATIVAGTLDEGVGITNHGICCFDFKAFAYADRLLYGCKNPGEYCQNDIVEIMINKGLKVGTFKLEDPMETMRVNNRIQLSEATGILRQRILRKHMSGGVTVIDPGSTYIDDDVSIGADTVIYPGTIIESGTVIGEECTIGPNSRIAGCHIGRNAEISYSVVLQSRIGNDTQVGPFAYIRPESCIGSMVKIGDFVEIKKSAVGNMTKIPHLAYVGDAEIGTNTNIACGVVTVNYNGKVKSRTVIGNNAFIGCNANLVAPVRIGDNSYIAAGSTITEEVPENSLAIARERQVIKENWVINKGMQREVRD
jgi:bifunctional UDP-N-acetylglucosamine pyrophosphorylase/glucosamine-1-phosphate N-acetyltransferase